MKIMDILSSLWDTCKTILPILTFLFLFQTVILKKPIDNVKSFVGGVLMSMIGLYLFLHGVSASLLYLGDSVGKNLVILDNKYFIIGFGFVLGYFATLVEPALKTLALEVEEISIGAIPSNVLLHAVAIGFGSGMSLGIFKIVNNVPTKLIITPIILLSLVLGYFAPPEFVDIAIDSASSTTGPVNIPLNMSIALGLSKILEKSDPLLSGFGIIGLTSLGAVVSVLILGVLTKL